MDRKSNKMKDPKTKNASQCARNLTRHAFLKVIIRVSKQVKKRGVPEIQRYPELSAQLCQSSCSHKLLRLQANLTLLPLPIESQVL